MTLLSPGHSPPQVTIAPRTSDGVKCSSGRGPDEKIYDQEARKTKKGGGKGEVFLSSGDYSFQEEEEASTYFLGSAGVI